MQLSIVQISEAYGTFCPSSQRSWDSHVHGARDITASGGDFEGSDKIWQTQRFPVRAHVSKTDK